MDPDLPHPSREHLIAMLTLLPFRLGFRPEALANWPDVAAWRGAQELALTLRTEAREFTFLHSLDAERSDRLVVECRCGTVQGFLAADCYRKMLAMNHENFAERPSVYALDTSTRTVIHSTAYLLESLDIDKLTEAVIDEARLATSWREEFAPARDVPSTAGDSTPLLQI
jgi:hypothetical protein